MRHIAQFHRSRVVMWRYSMLLIATLEARSRLWPQEPYPGMLSWHHIAGSGSRGALTAAMARALCSEGSQAELGRM